MAGARGSPASMNHDTLVQVNVFRGNESRKPLRSGAELNTPCSGESRLVFASEFGIEVWTSLMGKEDERWILVARDA